MTFEYTRNAQIWPRSQSIIGGSTNSIYLVVADSGVSSGNSSGLEFVNGFAWLCVFSLFRVICTLSCFFSTVNASTQCMTRIERVSDSRTLLSLTRIPTSGCF
jgi:hypothetical protein